MTLQKALLVFSILLSDLVAFTILPAGVVYWVCKKLEWPIFLAFPISFIGLGYTFYRLKVYVEKNRDTHGS